MTGRARRALVATALAAAALVAAAPSSAWAHASLLATSPAAQRVTPHAPDAVALTFSEAIEPRFAIISITDVKGHQVTQGTPERAPAARRRSSAPFGTLDAGWYLALWRVISADGHPVRGAFTFAVGPGPGPPTQFVIPSLKETAATPGLSAARLVAFARDHARDRAVRSSAC